MSTRKASSRLLVPSLIVFGPSAPRPTEEYLQHTRHVLLEEPGLSKFADAIRGLPHIWPLLVEAEPALLQTPSLECLKALCSWLETGSLPSCLAPQSREAREDESIPPNTLLSPLTVIIHIVQFFEFHKLRRKSQSALDTPKRPILVQGFCTGLLAAQAVVCSSSDEHFVQNAGSALRLAAAIGALVDLNGIWRDPPLKTSCIVARWSSAAGLERLERTLQKTSSAYISVVQDKSRVTITLPDSIEDRFLSEIRAAHIQASRISLGGAFHTPKNQAIYKILNALSDSRPEFSLPTIVTSSEYMVPSSWEHTIENTFPDTAILEAILLKKCDWASSIATTVSNLPSGVSHIALTIGLLQCIPTAVMNDYGLQVVSATKHSKNQHVPLKSATPNFTNKETRDRQPYGDDAIAIIGMSCRFPGSDSMEQFWDIISDCISTVSKVPKGRFGASEDTSRIFHGNFLREPDVFDHRFFSLSAQEAAHMDPQQRLILQVAYEAVESSGYLKDTTLHSDAIGCYIGVGSVDYQDNVASHSPRAFSAIGTLRAFIAGRISHHFGWTGPSLTYDTACSSSLVAINNACKEIRSGECHTALAGGVNVMTSPFLFGALDAANFLSRTGPCKPFDDNADGYCRGEGCGLVVLKRLSHALAVNDKVLAVISSSAMNQSENSTPITVPHSGSQIKLYQQVTSAAGVSPAEVTYLEAHGTGTPKGDPIEMESIRSVFGDKARESPIVVGSVKANIGHLEAASGVAALIKVVLMIQKNVIPALANFKHLNRNIAPLQRDGIEIATEKRPWNTNWKAACINNYGAAGSNACVLVCEPPSQQQSRRSSRDSCSSPKQVNQLFHISARTKQSLREYCKALEVYIKRNSSDLGHEFLSNLAFNLAYRHNLAHTYSFTVSVSSSTELRRTLQKTSMAVDNSVSGSLPSCTPVVLCFGGQTKDCIAFCESLYDNCTLLRHHLHCCETICIALGHGRIFPHIFERDPITDLVDLHCGLFAVQYSCAKAWIESGLVVEALVGHSFGQLTALCISGVLSLKDTLSFIVKRARLIQESWGPEKGAMLSVEAEKPIVDQVLASISGEKLNIQIACHNSLSTFVLAGSTTSIAAVEKLFRGQMVAGTNTPCRRLGVTHGFHSPLVDAIMPELLSHANGLTFFKPNIPVEICSEQGFLEEMTPEQLVRHSRQPVFFKNAISRLANRLGSACWIEAGSGSGIISMVKRNLASRKNISHHLYLPTYLEPSSDLGTISDSVATLLRSGINVRHWAHHPLQHGQYALLNIPLYQFEKPQHWLDYKDRSTSSNSGPRIDEKSNTDLVRLIAQFDGKKSQTQFRINTDTEDFVACVKGHSVLGNALCPASLYVEMASRAASILTKEMEHANLVPRIEELKMLAPLGLTSACPVDLYMNQDPARNMAWAFRVLNNVPEPYEQGTIYAEGIVSLQDLKSRDCISDKRRYQRLVGIDRCDELLSNADAETMKGQLIYDSFASIVDYQEYYRGVRCVSSINSQAAGIIRLEISEVTNNTITHPLAIDNFLQIAGLHVNIMKEREKGQLFLCSAINDIHIYNDVKRGSTSSNWTVYATFETVEKNSIESDIYVFDPKTNMLDVALLGVQFTGVRSASLQKNLQTRPTEHTLKHSKDTNDSSATPASLKERNLRNFQGFTEKQPPVSLNMLQDIIADIMQVPRGDIRNDSTLVELGVDSLVGIELSTEISKKLDVKVSLVEMSNTHSVLELSQMINSMVAKEAISNHGLAFENLPHHNLSNPIGKDANSEAFTKTTRDGKSEKVAQALATILSELLSVSREDISHDFDPEQAGLDSLLAIELSAEIEKRLFITIPSSQLSLVTIFGDLVRLALDRLPQNGNAGSMAAPYTPESWVSEGPSIIQVGQIFASVRESFDGFAAQSQFVGFHQNVYPTQGQLVVSYVVEALHQLGCPLAELPPNSRLPKISYDTRYDRVFPRLLAVLEDAGLICDSPSGSVRSKRPVPVIPSATLYEAIIDAFPEHALEHRLLHATGSKLANCLSGDEDPLQLIFGQNKQLVRDVYAQAPMFSAITKTLAFFLSKAFDINKNESAPFRILEVGAGTGGTTEEIIKTLSRQKVHFEYYFTDVSQSFVTAAKQRFASYSSQMKFVMLDIERTPPQQFHSFFHVILSANCIHATRDLRKSTSNIRAMLRSDGILCLVELTRPLLWFDLVFGLLDGWWRFTDDRNYALVHEWHWDRVLRGIGFAHVDWTVGDSVESTQLRVVLACNSEQERGPSAADRLHRNKETRSMMETIAYSSQGNEALFADIYYPVEDEKWKVPISETRPVALMIHGGGHVMLSRRDIPPSQINLLLEHGFLPISVDYRLCPEISLESGPMSDVLTALAWARQTLPHRSLSHPHIHADGERVVVVGWSTGGMLAMSLGWTAIEYQLEPPDAILSFYGPTNYADDWWMQPIFPNNSKHLASTLRYSVREGLKKKQITAYNVPSLAGHSTKGGWMATEDPRSRIALHMNWKAQTLPILMGALAPKVFIVGNKHNEEEDDSPLFPQPDQTSIRRINPHAQIQMGNYNTPTCLIHGSLDDLIPISQIQGTYEEMQKAGVASRLIVVEGAGHLFDSNSPGQVRNAVQEAYEFLRSFLTWEL